MNNIQFVKVFSTKERAEYFQQGNIILKKLVCDTLIGKEYVDKDQLDRPNKFDPFYALYMYDQAEFTQPAQETKFVVTINDPKELLSQILKKVYEANIKIYNTTPHDPEDNLYYRVVKSQAKECKEHYLGITLYLENQFEQSTDECKWKFYKVKDERYRILNEPLEIVSPNYKEVHEDLLNNHSKVHAQLHLSNIEFESSLKSL